MPDSPPPTGLDTVKEHAASVGQDKEQPWKKWIGQNTDQGVEDDLPDVVHIEKDGAQPINLGG